jgi:hypothetical protein
LSQLVHKNKLRKLAIAIVLIGLILVSLNKLIPSKNQKKIWGYIYP